MSCDLNQDLITPYSELNSYFILHKHSFVVQCVYKTHNFGAEVFSMICITL